MDDHPWVDPVPSVTDWRSRRLVTVASDVSSRDGTGWEFSTTDQEDVWFVFREDGGDFPVFSAARGDGELPPIAELEAMTKAAVADLMAGAGAPDPTGWLTANISAALLMAASDVLDWEGEEWALECAADDVALAWADDDDGRVPFAWLRSRGVPRDAVVSTYQDDGSFGLCFIPTQVPTLPPAPKGELRPRRAIPLPTGPIRSVEVVCDTTAPDTSQPGLITETLLRGVEGAALLIAAEAHSRDEWRLYDESVVVLTDPSAADRLPWLPPRRAWRSTLG